MPPRSDILKPVVVSVSDERQRASEQHASEQLTPQRIDVSVTQWDIFELALQGPSAGRPFIDVELSADFTQGDRTVHVGGFYDGNGTYRIRFMPDTVGEWHYHTHSKTPALDARTGSLQCVQASPRIHGPVRVHNTFHFAYADGTPFSQIGTTCYAWTHQGKEIEEQTLTALKESPFNKVRMCIFPKRYAYNGSEPTLYPFEGSPPRNWDFTRFNPLFFQHQENRVAQLRHLGIEADIILFHPYDEGHWGFDRMDRQTDERYVKYVVARFAAFSNVWWSMANEFDFMKEKQPCDWDRFFQIVEENDPYGHLRSIHNGKRIYDHNKRWVTHASIQNGSAVQDFGRAILYRDVYYKPIVFDEVKYEGNLPQRWGDISAEEMVHRFWQGTIAGTYVGHGETYLHPDDIMWWARGGKFHGKSPARLTFLREILESGPRDGLEPIDKWQDQHTAGKPGEYYLIYFGKQTPTEWVFDLPREALVAGMQFQLEIIDTWNMTITPVDDAFTVTADTTYRYHAEGQKSVKLPGRPYMAIRARRIGHVPLAAQKETRIYGE
jgi:hypothetical protein